MIAAIGIDIGKNWFHVVGLGWTWGSRTPAEVVAWAGGSTARQYAALPGRHGGLCRGASSQPPAQIAWPRCPTDSGEVRPRLTASAPAATASMALTCRWRSDLQHQNRPWWRRSTKTLRPDPFSTFRRASSGPTSTRCSPNTSDCQVLAVRTNLRTAVRPSPRMRCQTASRRLASPLLSGHTPARYVLTAHNLTAKVETRLQRVPLAETTIMDRWKPSGTSQR